MFVFKFDAIFILAALFIFSSIGSTMGDEETWQKYKIDAKLDVAVTLSYGLTESERVYGELTALKQACAEFFVNDFDLGNDKVRIGAVQMSIDKTKNGHTERLDEKMLTGLPTLTTDGKKFAEAVMKWQSLITGSGYNGQGTWVNFVQMDPTYALQAIDERLFADASETDDGRQRVVILILGTVSTTEGGHARMQEVANNLRSKKNVWMYTLAFGVGGSALKGAAGGAAMRAYRKDPVQRAYVDNEILRDSKNKPITLDKFDKPSLVKMLKQIKWAIVRDLCGWDGVCRWPQEKGRGDQCMPDVFQVHDQYKFLPKNPTNEKICEHVEPKPTSIFNCTTVEQCAAWCTDDYGWRSYGTYEEVNCSSIEWQYMKVKCGKSWDRNENDLKPLEHAKRYAYRDKLEKYCTPKVVCNPCPTRKPRPPRPPHQVTKEEVETKSKTVLSLTAVAIAALIVLLLAGGLVFLFLYRRRRQEQQVANRQMTKLTETIRTMSVYMQTARPSAETALAADLQSIREGGEGSKGAKSRGPIKSVTAVSAVAVTGGGGGAKSTTAVSVAATTTSNKSAVTAAKSTTTTAAPSVKSTK